MKEKRNVTFLFEKRIPAFLIDMGIAGMIQAPLMFLLIMLPLSQGKIKIDQVMGRILLITAISSIYLIFRDTLGGRSLGKRLMKLCVRASDDDRGLISPSRLVLRNLFVVLWPIEAILLLSGKDRLGDRVAKTTVVQIEGTA